MKVNPRYRIKVGLKEHHVTELVGDWMQANIYTINLDNKEKTNFLNFEMVVFVSNAKLFDY